MRFWALSAFKLIYMGCQTIGSTKCSAALASLVSMQKRFKALCGGRSMFGECNSTQELYTGHHVERNWHYPQMLWIDSLSAPSIATLFRLMWAQIVYHAQNFLVRSHPNYAFINFNQQAISVSSKDTFRVLGAYPSLLGCDEVQEITANLFLYVSILFCSRVLLFSHLYIIGPSFVFWRGISPFWSTNWWYFLDTRDQTSSLNGSP